MTYSNEDSLICSKCGKSNDAGSLFCNNCGNSLKKEEVVEEASTTQDSNKKQNVKTEYINDSSKNYTDEELNLFLEKNQLYYMEKFRVIESTGSKVSWNWCSFLISGYWMFYRKMYIQAILYIVANFVLGLIPFIGWIGNIALWICAGLFGNYFYLEHVKKQFCEISCADSSNRSMLIQKRGGTNIVIPIILLIIPVVIGIIIAMFFAALGTMSYYYY